MRSKIFICQTPSIHILDITQIAPSIDTYTKAELLVKVRFSHSLKIAKIVAEICRIEEGKFYIIESQQLPTHL